MPAEKLSIKKKANDIENYQGFAIDVPTKELGRENSLYLDSSSFVKHFEVKCLLYRKLFQDG